MPNSLQIRLLSHFINNFFVLTVLIISSSFSHYVYAQDDEYPQADISAAELLSGDADAKIAALGQEAEKNGYQITITAPSYWMKMVNNLLESKAESPLNINQRTTIIEAVIIRLRPENTQFAQKITKPSETVATAKPQVESTTPLSQKPQKPVFNRPKMEPIMRPFATADDKPGQVALNIKQVQKKPKVKAKPKPEPIKQKPTNTIVKTTTAKNNPIAAKKEPAKKKPITIIVEKKKEVTKPVTLIEKIVGLKSPHKDQAKRILNSLKLKQNVTKTMTVDMLKLDDSIYVDQGFVLVIRKLNRSHKMYWLTNGLNINATTFEHITGRKYKVISKTSQESIQRTAKKSSNIPDGIKNAMEQQYNKGKAITKSLTTNNLKQHDMLYINGEYIVVVRRDSRKFRAYWLNGNLDLLSSSLLKKGSNRYKVVRDF